MRALVCAVVLCSASPALATEPNPLRWSEHRQAADIISSVAVGVQIGAETIANLRSEEPKRALGCQAIRVGLTAGIAELTKRLVHRERPDGSDRLSFFSAHTAHAMNNTGWKVQVSVPIALGVGYLRPSADKHFVSDVLVGAVVGVLTRTVCSTLDN